MKIRLSQCQLLSPVPFGGHQTTSLLASQATTLEYESEDELIFAQASKRGSPLLLIPETNVAFMIQASPAVVAPPPEPPEPPKAPVSDTIVATAPGQTRKK